MNHDFNMVMIFNFSCNVTDMNQLVSFAFAIIRWKGLSCSIVIYSDSNCFKLIL